ncbi:diacylglycerol/lipid kinase family protein [Cytobacillus sp. Hz8]|uniref:diacylglycerol/lipid kinase family protein n=1 Tax=Cytobacillus sp. Hz8 TaxID=3347168 RepID=UPI0035DE5312
MVRLDFIINPQAGNGKGQKVWQMVEKELQAKNISYTAQLSQYRGHVKEIAASLFKGRTETLNIVVIGGDGTLNEAINSISNEERVRLGFIPGGSGNDFSRGFGIPKNPLKALETIIDSLPAKGRQVDVGFIVNENEEKIFFINNMGVGFDALICKEAEVSRVKKWLNRVSLGNFVYAIILLRSLFTFQCTKVQITIDGIVHEFHSTWFVTIANQPYYGGGMKISPDANASDGLLNITIVHDLSKLKLLLVSISVFWGGHVRFKEVHSFVGREISIQTASPLLIHVDGELAGSTPVKVKVRQKAIPIILND